MVMLVKYVYTRHGVPGIEMMAMKCSVVGMSAGSK